MDFYLFNFCMDFYLPNFCMDFYLSLEIDFCKDLVAFL